MKFEDIKVGSKLVRTVNYKTIIVGMQVGDIYTVTGVGSFNSFIAVSETTGRKYPIKFISQNWAPLYTKFTRVRGLP